MTPDALIRLLRMRRGFRIRTRIPFTWKKHHGGRRLEAIRRKPADGPVFVSVFLHGIISKPAPESRGLKEGT